MTDNPVAKFSSQHEGLNHAQMPRRAASFAADDLRWFEAAPKSSASSASAGASATGGTASGVGIAADTVETRLLIAAVGALFIGFAVGRGAAQ